jgi:hypothetical protein
MTATNPAFKNSDLAYACGRHTVITIPIAIAAGVPSFKGDEKPSGLIEKGLAGSQAILTQTLIDALLGSTNEVVASGTFGTTAMAADNTFGFVIDCDGQIERVDLVEAQVDITSTGAIPGIGFGTKTALTDASFTNPEAYVSASGNVAVRVLYSNISATGTTGTAFVKLHALLK